jgi:hypothetical protein
VVSFLKGVGFLKHSRRNCPLPKKIQHALDLVMPVSCYNVDACS